MIGKLSYCAPASRIGEVSIERNFLSTVTTGGLNPGQDPGQGGSWEFGDED